MGPKLEPITAKRIITILKKIERHLAYIEEKTNEYLSELDKNDLQELPEKVKCVQEKIERLKTHKIKYEALSNTVEASGEPQISYTDAVPELCWYKGKW